MLDESRHEVRVDGQPVTLTATEFGILATLARDPGVVVGRYDHLGPISTQWA